MVKNPLANAGDTQDLGSIPGSGRSPGVENGNLPGKFHGQRRLMGYWPWGHQESDTTEQPNTHTLILYLILAVCHISFVLILDLELMSVPHGPAS